MVSVPEQTRRQIMQPSRSCNHKYKAKSKRRKREWETRANKRKEEKLVSHLWSKYYFRHCIGSRDKRKHCIEYKVMLQSIERESERESDFAFINWKKLSLLWTWIITLESIFLQNNGLVKTGNRAGWHFFVIPKKDTESRYWSQQVLMVGQWCVTEEMKRWVSRNYIPRLVSLFSRNKTFYRFAAIIALHNTLTCQILSLTFLNIHECVLAHTHSRDCDKKACEFHLWSVEQDLKH